MTETTEITIEADRGQAKYAAMLLFSSFFMMWAAGTTCENQESCSDEHGFAMFGGWRNTPP